MNDQVFASLTLDLTKSKIPLDLNAFSSPNKAIKDHRIKIHIFPPYETCRWSPGRAWCPRRRRSVPILLRPGSRSSTTWSTLLSLTLTPEKTIGSTCHGFSGIRCIIVCPAFIGKEGWIHFTTRRGCDARCSGAGGELLCCRGRCTDASLGISSGDTFIVIEFLFVCEADLAWILCSFCLILIN